MVEARFMNRRTWKKDTMGKEFDPERHGMILCLRCGGLGRLVDESNEITVCRVCGGALEQ